MPDFFPPHFFPEGEFTGPNLFRPEAHPAYSSSKLCKFISTDAGPKSLQISEQILVCGLVIVTYQDQISSKNPLNYKGVQAAPLESLALGNPTSAASHLGIHKKSGDEQ